MWQYNELYHHGIKGQKWGVRRFQNEDGTLTEAGKKRYRTDVASAEKALRESREQYRSAEKDVRQGWTKEKQRVLDKAKNDLDWAKRYLQSERIKEKLNAETKVSKHRLKLQEHYKQKGMSEEEAAVAAYKRDKTEKVVAIVGGLTLAAAAAYVGYKEYDKRVDKFLSSDVLLKRVAGTDTASVHEGFYAALESNKGDVKKYLGLYGKSIEGPEGKPVFQKTIKLGKGLKVASEKKAASALKDVLADDRDGVTYLKRVADVFSDPFETAATAKQRKVAKKAAMSLKKGKIDENVYELFNLSLSGGGNPSAPKVYARLREMGYGAVEDLNDRRWSGYGAKNPVIVFDTAKAVVEDVRNVPLSEVNNRYNIEQIKLNVKALAKLTPYVGAAVGVKKAVDAADAASRRDEIVKEYRTKHPGTELSYNEILKTVQNGKG